MATLADILRQTGYAQDGTLATPTPVESPMTTALAEHIRNIPQKFEENQRHQMDLLARAYPGTTFKEMMLNGDPAAMNELAMQVPLVGMVAYHGTPHNILGKFDISKVGTGEGAQSYGHGMYFAEAKPVAEQYRENLAPGVIKKIDSQLYDSSNPEHLAAHYVDMFGKRGMKPEEIAKILTEEGGTEAHKLAANIVKKGTAKPVETEKAGYLYKVDIPDEHIPNMLDWDKPFKQQTKEVQNAIKKSDWYKEAKKYQKETNAWYNDPDIKTGQSLYQYLQSGTTDQIGGGMTAPEASKFLNSIGVKGIRYLDEGSRGNYQVQTTYKGKPYSDVISFKTKGQLDDFIKEKEAEGFGIKTFPQTSNFVVFDPTDVSILEKNSQPVSRKELIEKQVKALKDTGE